MIFVPYEDENMRLLIEKHIISEDEIITIVTKNYIPMVKALSYSISDEGRVTLYSHAPIGLETVEILSKQFVGDYDDRNPSSLMRTIDAINVAIKQQLTTGALNRTLRTEGIAAGNAPNIPKPISVTYPLVRLIWNRNLGQELRMESKNGSFRIINVHGHIGAGSVMNNDGAPSPIHENLDNNFGKSPWTEKTAEASGIEHFTRRSKDTLKSEVYAVLDEIKAFKLDDSLSKVITSKELELSEARDKSALVAIKTELNGLLNGLLVPDLKTKCYELLKRIQGYPNERAQAFAKDQLTTLAEETDLTTLKKITNIIEITLHRLVLNNILEEIRSLSVEETIEIYEFYIAKINTIESLEDYLHLKQILEVELERMPLIMDMNRMLTTISQFHGMEQYVSEQELIISTTYNIPTLEKIKQDLERKTTDLMETSSLRLKITPIIYKAADIFKKLNPTYPIDDWISHQKKRAAEYSLPDLEKLYHFLNQQLNRLILREKISERETDANKRLVDYEPSQFVEAQRLAIEAAVSKIKPSADEVSLQAIINELDSIIYIIVNRKEEENDELASSPRPSF